MEYVLGLRDTALRVREGLRAREGREGGGKAVGAERKKRDVEVEVVVVREGKGLGLRGM